MTLKKIPTIDPAVLNAIALRKKQEQTTFPTGTVGLLGTIALTALIVIAAKKSDVPPPIDKQLADLNRPKGEDGFSHEFDERGRIAESTEMPYTPAFVLGVKKQ